jgi:NADPH:quinone reductase-like Zn-dependent oxidoreductase
LVGPTEDTPTTAEREADKMPQGVVCKNVGADYHTGLEICDIPKRKAKPGQIVINVLSCGIAFPDVLSVMGKHISVPTAPFVICGDVAGRAIEIGEGVQGFQVGDIVFGKALFGGAATEAVLDTTSGNCYHVPEGVPPHVTAGFEINYGTTYHGLIDIAKLQKGETLLILGASGGIGMSAIDIGKAVGAHVVACASSEEKLEYCREAGADDTINYEEADLRETLRERYPKGVDVVYDPVGGKWSEPALRATGWGGRFVVCGFAAGGETPKDAIPRIPLNLALLNERQILGVMWGYWKGEFDATSLSLF